MDVVRLTVNSLAKLGLHFQVDKNERGDITLLLDDGTRLRLRDRALEISRAVLQDPSEKQTSVAFWYETRRVGESTFFLMEKEKEGDLEIPVLRLAVRLPAPDRISLRAWKKIVEEALLQINIGEKKIHDGAWGDVRPE